MRRTRGLGLLVTLAMLLAILAGCVAPAAPAAPAEPAAEGEAAAASLEGAEITATYMQSGTYDKAAEQLKPAFEESTGAAVELVAAPWDVLNQNHITDLTTGTGAYDVMSGEFWIADVFDKMLPLDEYVERDGYGSEFIPGIWAPGPSNFYDGKRIGVPYSADAYGIYYNTEIFEQCGVTADWEREKAVAALDKLQSLLQYNPPDALGLDFNAGNALFLSGKAATAVGWPSFVRADADNPEKSQVVGKWAMAKFPGPGFPMVSAWNMFISQDSANPDAAWEWIKAYANPENGTAWMNELGIGSPFMATYEDEENVSARPYFYPVQMENLNRAKSLPWTFAAFEAFFRNEGDFHQGLITAEEMLDRVQTQWDEITVPPALVQLAEAQGLKQQ